MTCVPPRRPVPRNPRSPALLVLRGARRMNPEISCRTCGAPGRLYLGGRLCPRHAPGGPDGEVMRPFPDYTGRIPQVMCDNGRTTETGPGNAANVPGPSPQHLGGSL